MHFKSFTDAVVSADFSSIQATKKIGDLLVPFLRQEHTRFEPRSIWQGLTCDLVGKKGKGSLQ